MSEVRIPPLEQSPVLRDRVYETLEELVIDGTLAPGARLLEAELAEQLSVSRNPVREALTLLAHSGWVDLRPRQGAVVHRPTRKEIEDFFQVRTVLKVEAARLAAMNATEADVDILRDLVAQGSAQMARDDLKASLATNSAFHEEVGRIAANAVLDEVTTLMKKRLRWYLSPVVRMRGLRSWEDHRALVDAIAAGDADAATATMRRHCATAERLYREHVAGLTG
ncbi:GntR family transcriptional regulator [Euzebya sp.]|uniref:GntR family transcriptional regulator n=1 Tax=Euzebya sp. TaxID=1971409 RepID=UPI003512E259